MYVLWCFAIMGCNDPCITRLEIIWGTPLGLSVYMCFERKNSPDIGVRGAVNILNKQHNSL